MKVAIIEPLGIPEEQVYEIARQQLGDEVEIEYFAEVSADPAVQIERARGAEVVVDTNIKLTEEAIRGFDSCKLLDIAFTGIDHVDMDTCRELGIMVCGHTAVGRYPDPVSFFFQRWRMHPLHRGSFSTQDSDPWGICCSCSHAVTSRRKKPQCLRGTGR